ncbi:hypothetical protein C8J57DRAFT_416335 [Mycena rebaudengoi]|nr:hypothetical protein C8J57DRAFT_416335 [Mycena rebaudengoi]
MTTASYATQQLTATSVLAQAYNNPSTSTSPAHHPSSTYPTSTYPATTSTYPATTAAQHNAQQRPTLVIPSSTSSTANATNSRYNADVNGSSAPAYRAASYTSLGSAVTPSYSVTPYSGGSAAQYSSGASSGGTPYSPLARCRWVGSGRRRSGSRRGSEVGLGTMRILRLRRATSRNGIGCTVGGGERGGVAVCDADTGGACERLDGAVRPGRLLADASTIRDTAIHDAGRDVAHADGEVWVPGRAGAGAGHGVVGQQDLYFYTLASSPASTSSSSATSESCSASEESTSEEEEEEEGQEEGYDAPVAYMERAAEFASRHAAEFTTQHPPPLPTCAAPRAPTHSVPLLTRVGRVGRRARVGRGGRGDGVCSWILQGPRPSRSAAARRPSCPARPQQ